MSEQINSGFEPIKGLEHLGEEDIERLIAIDGLLRARNMPIDDLERASRVNAWNGFYKDSGGDAHKVTMAGIELRPPKEELANVYEPAVRAEIRPSRRKKIERMGKLIVGFADTQIGYRRVRDTRTDEEVLMPTHSEEMLDIICQVNARLMPDIMLNLSDTADLAELSRFQPEHDHWHRTLAPTFQRVHDFYAQLYADHPNGERIEVDSNHTARPIKNMMNKMPEFYGFTLPNEEYPLMSYYRLAALDGFVKFISGYGGAAYVHGEEYGKPPIVAKHGTFTSNTPGGTVRKELQHNPETHIIRGHGHSHEEASRIDKDGNHLRYIQIGSSCLNNGLVEGFNSAVDDFGNPVVVRHNWPNQLIFIEDFEDGTYNFQVADIMNGTLRYKDIEFRANGKPLQ